MASAATREQQHEQEPEQGDRERDRDPQVDEEHDQDPAEQVLDVELLDVTGDGARRDVRPIPRFDVTVHVCAVTGRDATVERDDVVADAAGDQDVAVHDEDAAGDVPANGDPTVADEDPTVDGAVDGDRPVERTRTGPFTTSSDATTTPPVMLMRRSLRIDPFRAAAGAAHVARTSTATPNATSALRPM